MSWFSKFNFRLILPKWMKKNVILLQVRTTIHSFFLSLRQISMIWFCMLLWSQNTLFNLSFLNKSRLKFNWSIFRNILFFYLSLKNIWFWIGSNLDLLFWARSWFTSRITSRHLFILDFKTIWRWICLLFLLSLRFKLWNICLLFFFLWIFNYFFCTDFIF
jgi:hypothetical protein